jgi:hypothetical protein
MGARKKTNPYEDTARTLASLERDRQRRLEAASERGQAATGGMSLRITCENCGETFDLHASRSSAPRVKPAPRLRLRLAESYRR